MSHAPIPSPSFEVFFDGGCPLCRREMQLVQRWDRHHRIRFTDIDAPEFDARQLGLTQDEMMAEIYGRLPDGRLIRGVEVFRQLYGAIGLRALVALTRWPGVARLLDLGYAWFAKRRLKWTGRCHDGACRVGAPRRSDGSPTRPH